jgi:hypothetical protein
MSTLLGFPQLDQFGQGLPPVDSAVRDQVYSILSGLYPQGKAAERRTDQRFPYPHLMYLTPVGSDGLVPSGDSVVVVGKNLSLHGLGFYYYEPLPYRRMIASLELPEARWAGFLIDVTWCRFTQHGWYDSGGRFIQAVASPILRRRMY